MYYSKFSFILCFVLISLLFHSITIGAENMTDEEIIAFCQKAADGISPIPGLTASDIQSIYEIKSKEEGTSSFLAVNVNQYEVSKFDDFQALIKLDDDAEILEIKPDTQKWIENPEWLEGEISFAYDLNFGMKLKLLMEKESYPYVDMKVYYEEVDDNLYRVRGQGESVLSLEVEKESDRIIYYQNNVAVAGLKVDKELSEADISEKKEEVQAAMIGLLPLPKGAELSVATSVPWNKGIGTTENVYLMDLEYNHMMGQGENKSTYYGDFITYFVNPENEKLVLYNCKWTDLD